jgi:glycosyltransferase involved in cell wall biosynthesis
VLTRDAAVPESLDALSRPRFLDLLDRLEADARKVALALGLEWEAVMRPGAGGHSPARQALTILRWGLFDEAFYLAMNADVAASAYHPLTHYVKCGDAEGRRPNPWFDPRFYWTQFDTPGPRAVCALYHYAALGESLGLRASRTFDPRRYVAAHPALQPWVDRPLTHFLHVGREAGLAAHQRRSLTGTDRVRVQKVASWPRPLRADWTHGVNVIGPLDRVLGLGVSARGYLEGLRRAGVDNLGCEVRRHEFAAQEPIGSAPAFPRYRPDADINVVHLNGDSLAAMIATTGDALLKGKYNIGVWYWELPTLPPEWQTVMRYCHEFWAATPFLARTLAQSTSKPVRVLPPYLSHLERLRPLAGDGPSATTFLYCFDANSTLERKNPGALLDAFQAAFTRGSRGAAVRLTLKITYANKTALPAARLYEAAARDDRVTILDRTMTDAQLHALIASASVYVSPHRSEGLGLTVVEAMAAGVPVIATPFGGVEEFVSAEAAFPVDYRLVELPEDYPPYPRGFVWADPDVDSLARRLREAHEDRPEALRRAAVSRERVRRYYCSPALIQSYRAELRRIAAAGSAPPAGGLVRQAG